MAGHAGGAEALYARVSGLAASFDVAISPEELAELAVRHDMGEGELAALDSVFAYLAGKHHGAHRRAMERRTDGLWNHAPIGTQYSARGAIWA